MNNISYKNVLTKRIAHQFVQRVMKPYGIETVVFVLILTL